MVILDAVVYGAVELCCVLLASVAVIVFKPIISMWVNNRNTSLYDVRRSNSTVNDVQNDPKVKSLSNSFHINHQYNLGIATAVSS